MFSSDVGSTASKEAIAACTQYGDAVEPYPICTPPLQRGRQQGFDNTATAACTPAQLLTVGEAALALGRQSQTHAAERELLSTSGVIVHAHLEMTSARQLIARRQHEQMCCECRKRRTCLRPAAAQVAGEGASSRGVRILDILVAT